jgi:hypothetical protein
MRRSDKTAGRFVFALVAVVLAAAVLYFSGWATIVKNVAVLAWRGNAMVNLAKRTHFAPPPGAGVSEERLEAYIVVCGRIKPSGDKIDEWEAAHAPGDSGRRVSFKGGAAGLVGVYLREFSLALEQQRMGPEEFAWIEGRMRRAARSSALDGASESDRVLYGKYRARLTASALEPHALRVALGFAQ